MEHVVFSYWDVVDASIFDRLLFQLQTKVSWQNALHPDKTWQTGHRRIFFRQHSSRRMENQYWSKVHVVFQERTWILSPSERLRWSIRFICFLVWLVGVFSYRSSSNYYNYSRKIANFTRRKCALRNVVHLRNRKLHRSKDDGLCSKTRAQ